jgi:Tfp pilus assembly protein PilN
MRTTINLLPATARRQLMLRRRLIQWSAVVCTIVLLIWAARWNRMREYNELSQQHEVLSREYRPLQTMAKEIIVMRQQLEDLNQQELIAKELEHHRRVLTLFGFVSRAAQESQGRFRVTDFQLFDLQYFASGEDPRAAGPNAGKLTLQGVSLDSPTVAELLDKLQQSGLFTSVELVSLKEKEEGGVSLHDFQVLCGL